jgi:hypothetical protein
MAKRLKDGRRILRSLDVALFLLDSVGGESKSDDISFPIGPLLDSNI